MNSRLRGYEVDFLWPDERLVVEVDGYRYHSSPERFRADRLRDQELVASGYLVMRVARSHLVDEPRALRLSAPARGRARRPSRASAR